MIDETHPPLTTQPMRSGEFWTFFDQDARPRLGMRADTFAAMFSYLDRFNRPVGIVETGCVRRKDNWEGDGQSTLLFDKYAEYHRGSFVHTVDIDKDATAICSAMVSKRVSVHTGDSVAFLKSLDVFPIDLLYLNSFDLDMNYPLPSAIHHLKELVAIAPMISSETLVVVDDSPTALIAVPDGKDQFKTLGRRIAGKGQLIAEYAEAIGVKPYFVGYQCGWLGLGRARLGEISASIREEDRHNLRNKNLDQQA